MSELPDGWVEAVVDDTGTYINGMAFKPTDWEQDGRPIIRIQNLTDPNKPLNRTTREVEGRYIVSPGDLLVSWSATLDAFIWDREEAVLNQHIFKVEPNTNLVDPRFLFFGLREVIAEMREGEHLHGSTMKHINRGPFLAHRFPIAPLTEQRRIVAKLDRLSARTKAARAHLARVQSLATRAKQATLSAAFRGELTADWRDRMKVKDGRALSVATLNLDASERGTWSSEELPPTWEWRKFRESFIDLTDSRRKLPTNKYAEEGEFVVVDQGTKLFGGRSDARDLVHTADPPVIIFGDHTRCVKYVDRAFIQGADGVKVLKTASGVNLRFAFWALNAVELPDKGYSRHMKFLKATVFPIPPLEEQAEIVRRIEAAFARIDRMVEEATRAAHLLDRLDQRLLAKAFRGELVPQDPNDEPAAELLARIKAARAAAPRPKRGRRQRA